MHSFVSREYFILSARNISKRVLWQCIDCFKYSAKAAQQVMGSLPSIRLKPARPIKHSGVDYADVETVPIYILIAVRISLVLRKIGSSLQKQIFT